MFTPPSVSTADTTCQTSAGLTGAGQEFSKKGRVRLEKQIGFQ